MNSAEWKVNNLSVKYLAPIPLKVKSPCLLLLYHRVNLRKVRRASSFPPPSSSSLFPFSAFQSGLHGPEKQHTAHWSLSPNVKRPSVYWSNFPVAQSLLWGKDGLRLMKVCLEVLVKAYSASYYPGHCIHYLRVRSFLHQSKALEIHVTPAQSKPAWEKQNLEKTTADRVLIVSKDKILFSEEVVYSKSLKHQ